MERATSGGTPPLHARLKPERQDGEGDGRLSATIEPVSQEVLADAEDAACTHEDELSEEERQRSLRAAESLRRRQQDRELIDKLARRGFSGPEYEIFAAELVAYGYPIILGWLRRGLIWKHCADRGRPLSPTDIEREILATAHDERFELAIETVSTALRQFVDRVLLPGKWCPDGGATLTTYFIGACLLSFPNVFRRWQRAEQKWGGAAGAAVLMSPEGRTLSDLPNSDPADLVAARDAVMRELARMPTTTRNAAALVLDGMSFAEAAALLGTTDRAIEGLLYRYRQRRIT